MARLGQFRRDTLVNWQAINPILSDGEFVLIASDPSYPHKYTYWVCGDGTSTFTSLPMNSLGSSPISGITSDLGMSESLAISQKRFTELNSYLVQLEAKVVGYSLSQENMYINKDDGAMVSSSPVNGFEVLILNVRGLDNIIYTNLNWSGGDLVSLIACYDKTDKFLGSLLNGIDAVKDIISQKFEFLQNTSYIKLTTRNTATVVYYLHKLDLITLNTEKEVLYEGINNEFIRSFNLTSDSISTSSYKGLRMVSDSGVTHRNFALSKNNSIESVSCVFHPIGVNKSIRIVFGDLLNNYFINLFNEDSSGILNAFYCNPFELTAIYSTNLPVLINEGDEIRVDRRGMTFKIFINKTLVSSFEANKGFLGSMSGGFGWRDNTTNYIADNITLAKSNGKYMHISVDDTIGILENITNSDLNSIWEDEIFGFYKQMHDTYDAVFSLYCFYNNSTFNLSQVTVKFKDELINASGWLKFGVHAKNDNSNYNTLDANVQVDDYNSIVAEISRFAGFNSIDHIPRFHYFAAKKEALNILRNTIGLKGCLTADDNRVDNSGLTALERTVVTSCDDYYDPENDLYYCRTEYRIDSDSAGSIVPKLDFLFNSSSNNDIYIMFCHEYRTLSQGGRDTIEACIKWAKNKGIKFDFPQNNIKKVLI